MDYACGEVYSGCFTVRLRAPSPALAPADARAEFGLALGGAGRGRTAGARSLLADAARRGVRPADLLVLGRPLQRASPPRPSTPFQMLTSPHLSLFPRLPRCGGQTGGKRAGCCTAALFLKGFVEGVEPAEAGAEPPTRWAHIDIAGSMEVRRPRPRLFFSARTDEARAHAHISMVRLLVCAGVAADGVPGDRDDGPADARADRVGAADVGAAVTLRTAGRVCVRAYRLLHPPHPTLLCSCVCVRVNLRF